MEKDVTAFTKFATFVREWKVKRFDRYALRNFGNYIRVDIVVLLPPCFVEKFFKCTFNKTRFWLNKHYSFFF